MVLRIETVSPPQYSGPTIHPDHVLALLGAQLEVPCYQAVATTIPKRRDKYMSIYVWTSGGCQYSLWLFCHSGDLFVLFHIFYTALNQPSPTTCYWWQYLSMKSYWRCSWSQYVSLISTEYIGRVSFPGKSHAYNWGAVYNSMVFGVLFPVHSFSFEISDNSEHELDKKVQVYR